jgi:hypothetical protein
MCDFFYSKSSLLFFVRYLFLKDYVVLVDNILIFMVMKIIHLWLFRGILNSPIGKIKVLICPRRNGNFNFPSNIYIIHSCMQIIISWCLLSPSFTRLRLTLKVNDSFHFCLLMPGGVFLPSILDLSCKCKWSVANKSCLSCLWH